MNENLSLGELEDEAYEQALYLKSDYDSWDGRDQSLASGLADKAANLADLIIQIGKRKGKS